MLYTRAFHPLERLVVKHLLVQHPVHYVTEFPLTYGRVMLLLCIPSDLPLGGYSTLWSWSHPPE